MNKINMTRIAHRLVMAGFAAYVEQTGGGTATIYASRIWSGDQWPSGEPRFIPQYDANGTFELAAGPGWFEPRWPDPDRIAYAYTADFCYGPHDHGEAEPTYCTGATEHQVFSALANYLKEYQ